MFSLVNPLLRHTCSAVIAYTRDDSANQIDDARYGERFSFENEQQEESFLFVGNSNFVNCASFSSSTIILFLFVISAEYRAATDESVGVW